MRGTKSITHGSSTDPRITPACAGNSESRETPGVAVEDQPRVCGEQSASLSRASAAMGSPLRVRGTASTVCLSLGLMRITPACAGNRSHGPAGSTAPRDHPRVCGEQREEPLRVLAALGSPPRVRGTDDTRFTKKVNCRITPACAGNSSGG